MDPWLIILLIVVAWLALVIFIWLCGAAFGRAAYVACWVFLFPVMLIICIVIGFFLMWASREE